MLEKGAGLDVTATLVLIPAIRHDPEQVQSASHSDSLFVLDPFLGGFAKLRKETVSIVMPVCPSEWNSWAPSGRIFTKFGVSFFQNLSRKFKIIKI
jgi:hypothetical protein